jgi:PncC family amidohydrolase
MNRDDRHPLVFLAERLQELCLARGLTLSVAESCTGGLVASSITDVAGSSGYFVGGIVAYDDTVKARQLGVPAEVLRAHGAVSAQAARAMALGAREAFGTNIAVAVTGIAGPGGGSDSKPVGLTYVAVVDEAGEVIRRYAWTGDRAANKEASAVAALELVLEHLGEPITVAAGAQAMGSSGPASVGATRPGSTGEASLQGSTGDAGEASTRS